MNRKSVLIVGVCLFLVLLLAGLGKYTVDNRPKPPEPTATPIPTGTPIPTATPLGPIVVTGLGGPMLADPDVQKLLSEPWTDKNGVLYPPIKPDTRYANASSSSMNAWGADPKTNKPASYKDIDFVWSGDSYLAGQFQAMNKGLQIKQIAVAFNTKLMMFTWWRHLPAFMKSYVVKVDNYFIIPPEKAAKLLEYQDQGKTWKEAGIEFDDERFSASLVDLNGSAYGSSTGVEQIAWMANCFANGCKAPTDISQVPQVLPKLVNYVRQQGSQGRGSLGSFSEFLSNGEGTIAFIGYDSAFPTVASENGWSNELIRCLSASPDDVKEGCKKQNRVVGVYLGGGTNASHTYHALTENGVLLLKRLIGDPRIQKLTWEKLGMTTPATFLADAPVSWMSTNVQVGDKPRDEVYTALIAGLDAEFVKK